MTNDTANTSFEQNTLPFGTALEAESTGASNQRFTSYDRSTVASLDYAVNRSYSSGQGRFTSADPIGFAVSDVLNPQSFNLYAYVENNPVDFTDPTGLFLMVDWASCVTTGYIGRLIGFDEGDKPIYEIVGEIQTCGTYSVDPIREREPHVGGGGGGDDILEQIRQENLNKCLQKVRTTYNKPPESSSEETRAFHNDLKHLKEAYDLALVYSGEEYSDETFYNGAAAIGAVVGAVVVGAAGALVGSAGGPPGTVAGGAGGVKAGIVAGAFAGAAVGAIIGWAIEGARQSNGVQRRERQALGNFRLAVRQLADTYPNAAALYGFFQKMQADEAMCYKLYGKKK